MCGIAGLIGFNKENAKPYLNKMLDLIKHRGPDDRDTWFDDACSFGHVRLSIIDLSKSARQPMRCAHTGNTITYNGEVYNFLELREELQQNGYTFRTKSDTEVILAAYAEWGTECVHKFIGMFAFAIHDKRKKAVWLVRDRFGIKPLYYARAREGIVFASEIKALLHDKSITREVNLSAVKDFCRSRVLDASERTFFKRVYQLRAGCEMWVNAIDNVTIPQQKTYYSLNEASSRIHNEGTAKTIVDEMKNRIDDSVRLRLRSDVPFAAMLSGGLDSTAVATVASRHLNEPLHTYSALIDPSTPENDLIPIAEKMIHSIGHHNHQSRDDFFNDLLSLLYHQDEPFADGSMHAHYSLMRMIKRDGRSVVLSGQGGDEVFCGYQNYFWAYIAKKIRLGELNEAMHIAKKASYENGFSRSSLLKNSIRFCIPTQTRNWIIANISKTEGNILSKDARKGPVYRGAMHDAEDIFFSEYLAGFEYRTIPAFLHYEDRNSMAFGVEARVPLLDHNIVELTAALARSQPETLFLQGKTKSLLRRCMQHSMDDAITYQRGKYGFPAPLAGWLLSNQITVKGWLEELLPTVPFLDYHNVMKSYKQFVETNAPVMLNTTWRALIVTLWYHLFVTESLKAKAAKVN